MLKKIISGGQTGADQGALDAALKCDIPHGGWIPKGRLTESGPLSDKYQLNEMPTGSYSERTEKNITEADGTLVLTHGEPKGGSLLTLKLARKHNKPRLHINLNNSISFNAAREISNWIKETNIEILNVAGTRASEDSAIYEKTLNLLETVFFMGLMETNNSTRSDSLILTPRLLPDSVDEAVAILIHELPLKDRATISSMSEDELSSLHSTLGRYILTNFHLWSGNELLVESCRDYADKLLLHEDDAMAIIIRSLWQQLKKTHSLRIVK
ncbi:MAG: putative molybdenum carrier protein [Proteobacteria bacterium]|nr:putative molybdenum carrier protein [Pseudomonadota bacterium]